jgi:signal transduction histidine kinase
LIDNAVKFGGADQDIDIRIGTVADDACIHVSDRGPGVPRRYRATVFKGFAQGKAGLARPHGGFGVGLTLSRGIVQRHKGRMTLHDRDGGGATVTICLPRIEPPAG